MTDIYDPYERQAVTSAVGSIGDDPEQAGRALRLSQVSGIDPSVIHADVEGFDQQFNAGLTGQIVRGNPHLQDYINSHPMAAKVSNGDWHQLDAVSDALHKFSPKSVLGRFAEGFNEGVGPGGIGEWIKRSPGGEEYIKKAPISAGLLAIEWAPLEVPMRLIGGLTEGTISGVEETYKQFTGDDNAAAKLGRDLRQIATVYFAMQHGLGHVPGPYQKLAKEATRTRLTVRNIKTPEQSAADEAISKLADIVEATQAAEPWLKSGEEPPPGIHPFIDKLKIDQAKSDAKSFNDVFKESQASATRERSEESFSNFVRLKDKANIAISADAIRELYGEKEPHPEDNLLGWVPDIVDRLREAEAIGGDVEISRADLLAKMDPKVWDELKDHIRFRPGGVTIEEGKSFKEPTKTLASESAKLTEEEQTRLKALAEKSMLNELSPGETKEFQDLRQRNIASRRLGGDLSVSSVFPAYQALTEKQGGVSGVRISDLQKSLGIPMEQLHDFLIREARSGNVTLHGTETPWGSLSEEARQAAIRFPDEEKPYVNVIVNPPSAVQSVRSQASLDPLFAEGPIKDLRVKKIQQKNIFGSTVSHNFALTDEKGRNVGEVMLTEKDKGNALYIEWIQSNEQLFEGPNAFSLSLMRSMFRQLAEEFPKADFVEGERISGARTGTEKEGQLVRIPLKAFREEAHLGWDFVDVSVDFRRDLQDFFGGAWRTVATGMEALEPTDVWKANEKAILDEALPFIQKVLGEKVSIVTARAVAYRGRQVHGLYAQFREDLPILFWSLSGRNERLGKVDPIHTLRHEGMHHLIESGFYTPKEIELLERASLENGWIKKHGIQGRYQGENLRLRLREGISEEFGEWNRVQDKKEVRVTPSGEKFETIDGMLPEEYYDLIGEKPPKELPEAVVNLFQKLKDFLDEILEKVRKVLGFDPTWQDLFRQAERGEIKEREPTNLSGLSGRAQVLAQEKQPELPGVTRQEDLDLFVKARDIGMNAKQYKRYQDLIAKRDAEDIEQQLQRALKDEKRKQTKEWKENEAKVRDEVKSSIEQRPDIGVARFFGEGMLYGEKLKERPKLKSDRLTEEQKVGLPKNFISEKGIDPDDAAGLFGYQSGDTMIGKLIEQKKLQGELSLNKWVEKEIKIETEKQMQRKFGDLEQNILSEAKDHVLSTTQMDLLHEETVALGMRAGSEMPFSKEDIKSWVKGEFSKALVGGVKADKYLNFAGKAGRLTELALLDNEPLEAFKQKQRQYYSTLLAREAKKFEKEQAQFDRLAKQFSKREVASTPAEYTNFIHDILMRVGEPVRRSVQDLQEAIQFSTYKNLQDFVQGKTNEAFGLREFPIAEFLYDDSYRKPVDKMTVDEFRQVSDSLKTLAKQGRDEKKLIVAGDAFDLDQVKGEMVQKLETFPEKEYPVTEGLIRRILNLPRTYLASGINNETLLNRWDRNDPRGIFNKYIIYPLASAANYKNKLDRKYSKPYRALGKVVDADKKLDSPLIDPLTGEPLMGFTRNNAMAILQNIGNEGNWKVQTEGYKVDPEVLKQWLFRNTTKADWDRAQAMGDMFGNIFKEVENVYRRVTGVAPEKIELRPIDTPYGTYRGWYHPLIRDPIREGRSKAQRGGDVYDDNDYGHISLANGYTKRRTGATYPLSLNFDMIPSKISQMLHDIAFREVIIETQKIYNDTAFRAAVTKHYGDLYKDGLMPFLRGVAGAESINSRAAHEGARVSEFLRQNVISTYIGFNPYTVLKHFFTAGVLSSKEVGTVNFVRAVSSLYGKSEEIGLNNSAFAMKWSEELQRRERHWQDTVVGQHKDIYGKPTLRESIIQAGSWAVAQSDMASAKPTWLAAYRDAMEKGDNHGAAVDLADRAVRRAHGSTAITNQPALVRGGGALHGWLTTVYGFFGTVMQRRVELAHQINDTYKLGREGELKKAAANVPAVIGGLVTYVIWPTIVEEMVTGLSTEDKRGWGTHLFTASMAGMASSFLYIRDIVHGMVTGQEPSAGMISSPLHDVKRLMDDLKQGKKMFDKSHAGRLVGDTITVFGEATGMAPKAVGSAAKFGIDVVRGHERPKTLTDWRMGLTRGTIKKRVEK